MKAIARAACVCLALGFLSNCAVVGSSSDMSYAASTDATRIAASGKTFSLTVEDHRGVYREFIGVQRLAWLFRPSGVRSEEPVEQIIEKAVAGELNARGVGVESGHARKIDVVVTSMQSVMVSGLWNIWYRGTVAFSIQVTDASGEVRFDEMITAAEELTDDYYVTTENAIEPLERALAKAMTTLFENQAFLAALEAA